MNDNTNSAIRKKVSELTSGVPVDNAQERLVRPGRIAQLVNPSGEAISTETTPTPLPPSGTLKPFPDGQVLKYTENPLKRGCFNIFTGTGESVAVCVTAAMAELFVNAVNVMFLAAAELEVTDINAGKSVEGGLTKEVA